MILPPARVPLNLCHSLNLSTLHPTGAQMRKSSLTLTIFLRAKISRYSIGSITYSSPVRPCSTAQPISAFQTHWLSDHRYLARCVSAVKYQMLAKRTSLTLAPHGFMISGIRSSSALHVPVRDSLDRQRQLPLSITFLPPSEQLSRKDRFLQV